MYFIISKNYMYISSLLLGLLLRDASLKKKKVNNNMVFLED